MKCCLKHIHENYVEIKNMLVVKKLQSLHRCGHIFKNGDLIYHCNDCTDDETCVLCQKCFNKDVHKDHEYFYYLSKNSGGCCDCGEDESWKNPLCCPLHNHARPSDSNSL